MTTNAAGAGLFSIAICLAALATAESPKPSTTRTAEKAAEKLREGTRLTDEVGGFSRVVRLDRLLHAHRSGGRSSRGVVLSRCRFWFLLWSGQLLEQPHHFQRGLGALLSFVSSVAAGAVDRLLERVAG